MEVKINKEIRDYTESIFFGLSLRQLAFSLLAVGAAVALFFSLRDVLHIETLGWLCIVAAFPFAAMGFIKYNGMTFEKLIFAFIKSELLTNKKLFFRSENLYMIATKSIIEKHRKELRLEK